MSTGALCFGLRSVFAKYVCTYMSVLLTIPALRSDK